MEEKKQYENSGILFKNDRKTEDWHGDFTGDGNIDGKDYYISLRERQGQRGTFYTLRFKPKAQQAKDDLGI